MTDFSFGRSASQDVAPLGVISTIGPMAPVGQYVQAIRLNANAGALWPAANTIIYMPVLIPESVTIYQMGVEVTAQAGNYDVGIYDEQLNRLVNLGSTAVPAAGLAVANIADTTLGPGLFYFAMVCSDATTAAFRRTNPSASDVRMCGCAQQAQAPPLPATATFATLAQSYIPVVVGFLSSVTP